MSGPSSPPPAPAAPVTAPGSGAANYIPNNQAGVDTSYNQLFNQLSTGAQGLVNFGIPSIYNYANNIQNNPYAGTAQSGAVQGSDYALNTQIPALQQGAQNVMNLGNSAIPYAQQTLQAGFDPQNALYDRTLNKVMDSANAVNSMYGLSSSPYGAGLANNAVSNFNIDWQNNQLARQGQAATNYGNLASTIGGATSEGLGYMGQIPGTMTGATAMPYSTYNTLQNMPIQSINNAANTVQQLYNPTTAAMGSALGYMGTGINASAAFNNAQNANYADQMAMYGAASGQNSSNMAGMGALGGGLFSVASNPLSMFGTSLW